MIISFRHSEIARKLSSFLVYCNEDALRVPTIPMASELAAIHNAGKNIVRSCDERHLEELASEFRRGDSRRPAYGRFIAGCEKFLFALEAADTITRASFIYLWLLSRVLGRQMFLKVYQEVIYPRKPTSQYNRQNKTNDNESAFFGPTPSAIGLDMSEIDLIHRQIQLLIFTTDGVSWTEFKDSEADYGVDYWCDIEQGQQIDVCKNALDFLDKHSKVLLPVTRRDLWIAENLIILFGIGRIVESAEEYQSSRRLLSKLLWFMDPLSSAQLPGEDSVGIVNLIAVVNTRA